MDDCPWRNDRPGHRLWRRHDQGQAGQRHDATDDDLQHDHHTHHHGTGDVDGDHGQDLSHADDARHRRCHHDRGAHQGGANRRSDHHAGDGCADHGAAGNATAANDGHDATDDGLPLPTLLLTAEALGPNRLTHVVPGRTLDRGEG